MKPAEEILEIAKASWGLKEPLTFVRKVESYIYYSKEASAYLRLTQPSHRTVQQIQGELDYMKFLSCAGVSCVAPIPTTDSLLLKSISANDTTFHACLFTEAPGKHLKEADEFSIEAAHSWGQLLGEIHHYSKSYQPTSGIRARCQWDEEEAFVQLDRLVQKEEKAITQKYNGLMKQIQAYSKDKDSYALIHADFHSGNFHYDPEIGCTAFDFDDCHYSWFAYDVAIVFYYTKDMKKSIRWEDFVTAFWKGYETRNYLDDDCKQQIDNFILFRGYILYFWCKVNLENQSMNEESINWMQKEMNKLRPLIG